MQKYINSVDCHSIRHLSQYNDEFLKKLQTRISLAVQWLRLHASNLGLRVRSLVGEVRAHIPQGVTKSE